MADDFRSALIASAGRLGINPADLATVISYETGGTFSPSIRGGAGNRHIGLIQFGPNEQQRYGASQKQSGAEQLPAVEAYLTDRGFKPGMGILDLYSTINAGRPGRYNASDANNGGAPGTVADKVNNQMAGHRAKAAAFLGGEFTPTMPAAAGASAQSGRFGVGGVEGSATPAPVMATPSEPAAEKQTDVLALIAPLLQSGMQAMPAQAAAPQAPPQQMQQMAPAAPAAFDANRFWSLLKR
jgi:hypothetical protein